MNSGLPPSSATIAYLFSTQGIRERCQQIFDQACADRLQHFYCDLSQLAAIADYVIETMVAAYPQGDIPFHSRWRHLEVGDRSRLAALQYYPAIDDPLVLARAKFDLVIPSVLLDAGAGAVWRYTETTTGQVWRRSEGLAVASAHLFLQGGFSSHPHQPYQTDALGLQNCSVTSLGHGFQVSPQNPLVGLEGRVHLLQKLGAALRSHSTLFGSDLPRPGNLVDYLLQLAQTQTQPTLTAHQVLDAVLTGFSSIWPGRITLDNTNLGDVWHHSALPDQGLGSQLVPFHKLSQWLTYSLLEPLQDLGIIITQLDDLTGLPEYRNGGLFIDLGALHPKHPEVLGVPHSPEDEVIVEWRALTVILLDRVADLIRQKLGKTSDTFPLAKVLEGGTWAAGRRIAQTLRPQGIPPIQIRSDGTVF